MRLLFSRLIPPFFNVKLFQTQYKLTIEIIVNIILPFLYKL